MTVLVGQRRAARRATNAERWRGTTTNMSQPMTTKEATLTIVPMTRPADGEIRVSARGMQPVYGFNEEFARISEWGAAFHRARRLFGLRARVSGSARFTVACELSVQSQRRRGPTCLPPTWAAATTLGSRIGGEEPRFPGRRTAPSS